MNNVSPFQTGSKYGVILALISILITVILYVTGMLTNPSISMISGLFFMIIFIIVTVLAIRSHKLIQNGYLTLGKGFLVGILTSLIASIIIMIFYYVLYAFIDPDLMEAQLQMTEEMLENMGFMTDDQIEMAMDDTRSKASLLRNSLNNLWLVCCGGVVSLIAGLVLKNEPLQDNTL